MKIFRALAAILVAALALYGFGRFFLSQLGAGRALEPPGVIQAAPPDFHVVERGELSAAEAADALATLLLARPPGGKVGVKFQRAGSVVYWLADTRADTLEESAATAIRPPPACRRPRSATSTTEARARPGRGVGV